MSRSASLDLRRRRLLRRLGVAAPAPRAAARPYVRAAGPRPHRRPDHCSASSISAARPPRSTSLLPQDTNLDFVTFASVYVFACILGVVSHAPGGIGVFEATMLNALPTHSQESLLASLLLFRVHLLFPALHPRARAAGRGRGLAPLEQPARDDHAHHGGPRVAARAAIPMRAGRLAVQERGPDLDRRALD